MKRQVIARFMTKMKTFDGRKGVVIKTLGRSPYLSIKIFTVRIKKNQNCIYVAKNDNGLTVGNRNCEEFR
jgi:spore coat polysaccharide biosynthesis protein SpsF (cytidylyltransferase family)